jgi:protein-tyrosine phosphatase
LSVAASRVLAWDGCVNVRDLGGLPLEGGGETRFGIVVRADSIRALTKEGWQALADYGVRVAVDLRGDDEVELDPLAELPIEVVRFPMPGGVVPVVWEWPSMREAYLGLLGRFQGELTAAAVTVARSEAPVVIHCHGGRDRTGLACGLMLRLAGVSLKTIAADHALSDENWAPHNERWCAEARDEWERERRRRVTQPAGATMAEVLADFDVEEYLRGGGATREDLDTILVRLRG